MLSTLILNQDGFDRRIGPPGQAIDFGTIEKLKRRFSVKLAVNKIRRFGER